MIFSLIGDSEMKTNPRRLFVGLGGAMVVVMTLSACGGEWQGPGPDVRGMTLPMAEERLDAAGVEHVAHGDGTFGILMPENWIVCSMHELDSTSVRLEVAKRNC